MFIICKRTGLFRKLAELNFKFAEAAPIFPMVKGGVLFELPRLQKAVDLKPVFGTINVNYSQTIFYNFIS